MRPIRIIGGGLAGLTLGIELRQRQVPVEIWEAGKYPRHRVCGEFISGRGLEILNRMEIPECSDPSVSRPAGTAQFFAGSRRISRLNIDPPALCISRFDLDALLARQFERLGGMLRAGERRTMDNPAEAEILASGRRLAASDAGWRWIGVKAHATGLSLAADLEMHFLPEGYVGICQLPEGRANVCALFRKKVGQPGLPSDWGSWLRNLNHTALAQRLEAATFLDETFCSVAGIQFNPPPRDACCRIGDAWSMIPPVTGNGMSIAFESAQAACPHVFAFAEGRIAWEDTVTNIDASLVRLFDRRLRWARRLHSIFFSKTGQSALGSLRFFGSGITRFFFKKTR